MSSGYSVDDYYAKRDSGFNDYPSKESEKTTQTASSATTITSQSTEASNVNNENNIDKLVNYYSHGKQLKKENNIDKLVNYYSHGRGRRGVKHKRPRSSSSDDSESVQNPCPKKKKRKNNYCDEYETPIALTLQALQGTNPSLKLKERFREMDNSGRSVDFYFKLISERHCACTLAEEFARTGDVEIFQAVDDVFADLGFPEKMRPVWSAQLNHLAPEKRQILETYLKETSVEFNN